MLDFEKPTTPTQWIIFLAAIGITLSSPAGTRAFLGELRKHILDKQGEENKQYKTAQLSQALYHLKKRKAVILEEVNGKTVIKLTEKGKKRKLKYDIERLRIPKHVRWDGKWRIVSFDVPGDYSPERNRLRGLLKEFDFYQITGDMVNWLAERGVKTKVEDDLRMFPISDSSKTIIDCFLKEAKKHKLKGEAACEEVMACALGACLGCSIKTTGGYKTVCCDGPVFDLDEVILR